MVFDNLHEGMELKNYKTLCAVIGVNPTTGEGKQIQMEKLSHYLQFRKEGNRFIIEKILISPEEARHIDLGGSKSPYIKLIETLLVAKLFASEDYHVEYTYKELIQELNMASENYNKVYYKTSYDYIYNNIAPISKETYEDWQRFTYGENKKKIKSALESMQNRKLILFDEVQFVCVEERGDEFTPYNKYDKQYFEDEGTNFKKKYIHREPTEDEMKNYLRISRRLLEKHGCDNIDEIREKGLQKDYDSELSSEMKEKLGWKYMYKKIRVHHILKDSNDLLEKTKQNLFDEAKKQRLNVDKKKLNKMILNMINNIGKNNHDNAVSKLAEYEIDGCSQEENYSQLPNSLFKLVFRTKADYLPGWNILSDYYIAGDEEAARDKAKDFPVVQSTNDTEDDIDI